MRDFNFCGSGNKCINPNQGELTEEDYSKHYGCAGGRYLKCKPCMNKKGRERTALNREEPRKHPRIDSDMANAFLLAPASRL